MIGRTALAIAHAFKRQSDHDRILAAMQTKPKEGHE
jgi:hypothetical protein